MWMKKEYVCYKTEKSGAPASLASKQPQWEVGTTKSNRQMSQLKKTCSA